MRTKEQAFAESLIELEGNDFGFDEESLKGMFKNHCHSYGLKMGDVSCLPYQFLAGAVFMVEMLEEKQDEKGREFPVAG